jgi:hypothetical protein
MTILSLSYWFDPLPGPIGGLWPLYAALAFVFAGLAAWGAWRSGVGRRGRLPSLEAVLGVAGLGLVGARLLEAPLLGMRALAPGAAALALALPLLARAGPWRPVWSRALDALAFNVAPQDAPLSPGVNALSIGVYLAILVPAGRLLGQPWWYAPVVLAVLFAPQLAASLAPLPLPPPPSPVSALRFQGRGEGVRGWGVRLRPELLIPLLWPGLALALRVGFAIGARMNGGAVFAPPPAWDVTLDVAAALRAAAAYSVLGGAWYALRVHGRERWAPALGAAGLALALAGWGAAAYFTRATSGVTGVDPFAYVLMGVDLARTGLPLHTFPLVQLAAELDLPLQPVVHLGYHVPFDAAGHAATVWPPGHPVLLALGYRLLGERGLYLTTPLVALLSAALAGVLAAQLYPAGWLHAWRPPAAVVAAGLVATSPEQIVRALVPRADASAQLFTTLALALAWQGTRESGIRGAETTAAAPPWLALGAGACFGLAYDVRYTQLLLAPSFALLALGLPRWRARLGFYALFGLAALATALPDLWYHQLAFGNPLQPGSDELKHFALSNIWPMAQAVWVDMTAPGEFAWPWLVALAALGCALLVRAGGRRAAALLSGPVLVIVFHLQYGYLRVRDLLPEFPILAVLVAIGAAGVMLWIGSQSAVYGARGRGLALAAALVALSATFAARSAPALDMPFSPGFGTFGYLQPAQRAAFDRLAALTEPPAVVAATLNSGPVELYAGRATFRPADWTDAEALAFVTALRARGRPVYVLDDGAALAPVLAALRERYTLVAIASLPLPYFYPGGGSLNQDVWLYRVDQP